MFSDQTFTSAVDQERAVPGLDQSYRQMSPGAFAGRVRRLALPELDIVREQANRRIENTFRLAEGTTVALFHLSRSGGSRIDDVFTGPDMGRFIGGFPTGSRTRCEITGEAFDAIYLCMRGAPFPAGDDWGLFENVSRAAVRDMTLWLDGILWHASGASGPPSAELLAITPGLVLDRLALWFDRGTGRPSSFGQWTRVYGRIRDWLHDHADEAVTAQDMAAAFGLPARDLRAASREVAGQSLDELLRIHRLNLAHRDLVLSRDRPARVTDIAMQHGFLHLGRFSEQYRRFFGETPSQTLRRA